MEPEAEPRESGVRDSGMRLMFSIAIEYSRRRGITKDRWEARASTLGLLVAGCIVVVLVIAIALPRIFELLGHL